MTNTNSAVANPPPSPRRDSAQGSRPMRSLRSAAGSQLHQQARRKTSLLRVPGGQEAAAGLPAAAGARGGSRAVVARAPGTERNRCWLRLRALLRAVSYHSDTRRVSAELEDALPLDFCLPVPIRPGVRRKGEEAPSEGRTPRISRLMALAIRFDGLLSQGAVRNLSGTGRGRACEPRSAQPDLATESSRAGDSGTAALPAAHAPRFRSSAWNAISVRWRAWRIGKGKSNSSAPLQEQLSL